MPTVRPISAKPTCLRVQFLRARPVGVDVQAEVIRGYVLAQEGPFKSEGRGEFDRRSLEEIVRLTNTTAKGLRSRFTHPSMSSDGLGKYLGRATGAWLDTSGSRLMARADLKISPSSHDTPSGDLGAYVLRLAAEDPDAISSSLVLEFDEEYRLNPDGTPLRDSDNNRLPPLWRPTKLWATDVVDTGDAVDGILSSNLSAADLPDAVQRQGWAMLDRMFGDQSADVIRTRCADYVERYLAREKGTRATGAAASASAALTVNSPAAKAGTVSPTRPNRDRAIAIIRRAGLTSNK